MIGLNETNESGVAYLGWFVHLWAQSRHPALSCHGYDVHERTHYARIIQHINYNGLGGIIYPILSLENFPVTFTVLLSNPPRLPVLPSSPPIQPPHPVLWRKSNPPNLAQCCLNLPDSPGNGLMHSRLVYRSFMVSYHYSIIPRSKATQKLPCPIYISRSLSKALT